MHLYWTTKILNRDTFLLLYIFSDCMTIHKQIDQKYKLYANLQIIGTSCLEIRQTQDSTRHYTFYYKKENN